eukprot:gene11659-4896_t
MSSTSKPLKRKLVFEEEPSKKQKMQNKRKEPKKKLTISGLKVKPKIPETFEEDSWNKLKQSINAIFKKETVSFSQEELYKSVQDLCIHQKSQSLFEKLKFECEKSTKKILEPLRNHTTTQVEYLNVIVKVWEEFCSEMRMIRSIFLYLDRTFVITSSSSVRSIWDMGLELFKLNVIANTEVLSKIEKGILELVRLERNGDSIDKLNLKKTVQMFLSLGIYENLEKKIITSTCEYYTNEGKNLVQSLNLTEYLIHVEKRIKQEIERSDTYFNSQTRKKIISTLEEKEIQIYSSLLVEKGFRSLLSSHRLDDLSRMYQLFERVSCLDEIKENFSKFIEDNGLNLVQDKERDATLVQDLLNFKNKSDEILVKCFKNNEKFNFDYKMSFEKFVNSESHKVAQFIAKFIDGKLKTTKGITDEEIENYMNDSLTVFKFLEAKDVFEAFYKKDLAKRLLLGKSTSFDAEKSMISKLKTECGSQFTNKLEGMFKDIDLSKEIMISFKKSDYFKTAQQENIDINVTVITTGFWPNYETEIVNLPKNILSCQEIFKNFYVEKYTGRILKWQNQLSQCTLKANFPLGKKELQVSLFQSVVLLLFNDSDKLTFKELKENSGMNEKELKRTLQSLSVAKIHILKKNPNTKDVNDDDEFFYNKEFEHQLIRIRINQVQHQETKEEKDEVNAKVLLERQYAIDATIVRIMKSRKKLSHNLLLSEVFKQLKFPLKSLDVKKRIESLIERDYLERENEDSESFYIYQA